jgi:hypothetical protein
VAFWILGHVSAIAIELILWLSNDGRSGGPGSRGDSNRRSFLSFLTLTEVPNLRRISAGATALWRIRESFPERSAGKFGPKTAGLRAVSKGQKRPKRTGGSNPLCSTNEALRTVGSDQPHLDVEQHGTPAEQDAVKSPRNGCSSFSITSPTLRETSRSLLIAGSESSYTRGCAIGSSVGWILTSYIYTTKS